MCVCVCDCVRVCVCVIDGQKGLQVDIDMKYERSKRDRKVVKVFKWIMRLALIVALIIILIVIVIGEEITQ